MTLSNESRAKLSAAGKKGGAARMGKLSASKRGALASKGGHGRWAGISKADRSAALRLAWKTRRENGA